MTSVVFGIGVGLIILLSVWILAVFAAIISFRTQRNVGSFALAFAAIITCILLIIPLDSKTPTPKVHKVSQFFSLLTHTRGQQNSWHRTRSQTQKEHLPFVIKKITN